MSIGPIDKEVSPASWMQPLLGTLLVQATAAFLTRIIPTIAPATGRFDLSFYSVALMSALPVLILAPVSDRPPSGQAEQEGLRLVRA